VDGDAVWLELGEPVAAANEPRRALTLAPALLKGDKLADVVRMGTELGAVAFRPVLARRCDVRELSAVKLARLARIALEAARQSGQGARAAGARRVALDELVGRGRGRGRSHGGAGLARRAGAGGDRLTVITGPEGGWAPESGTPSRRAVRGRVRLGGRVLRAETAPVAMAAAWLLAVR
jgi:16S rRNA (uracil1498-N3)-methyltransferase